MNGSQIRWPLAILLVILVGVCAPTAPASNGHGAPVAHSSKSKKKGCKKKSTKSATAAKKKCKKRGGGGGPRPEAKMTITCPTGVISGSNPITLSGTASVGGKLSLAYNEYRYDAMSGENEPVGRNAVVDPDANGAWSFTFTPGPGNGMPVYGGYPWDERLDIFAYWPDDDAVSGNPSNSAVCEWMVSV